MFNQIADLIQQLAGLKKENAELQRKLENADVEPAATKKHFKGEAQDFYKTSWFVEFEALSRMVKVRGSCDKPFNRYSRLKNLLL